MIYVVMPHYILNEEIAKLAKNAIKSFQDDGCKVVSVDDHSPFDTECLSESDFIIVRGENGGFAKCMNTGLRAVLNLAKNDDLIVCANNDVETRGNWVEEAERCFSEFKADLVGGLGYRTKNIPKCEDNRVSEGGLFSDWMFPGGFFIGKKKFFETCGIYDENYAHGGIEDIDLFHIAKQKNKRLIMSPKIQYWHQEGATRYSKTQKEKQTDAIQKNELYFKEKYGFDPIQGLNQILVCNYINP